VNVASDVPQINPVKPPVKPTPVKPPPKAKPVTTVTVGSSNPAASGQANGVTPFEQFVREFYPQQAPPDYNQIVQQAIAPIIQQYQNAVSQLTNWNTQATQDNSSSMQALATLLQQIGGSEYTPALAAALAQQQQQIQAYNLAQAQNGLFSNFYGGSNGVNAVSAQALKDAQDAYNSSQPTGKDLMDAFNAYNSANNQQFNQNLATRKENLAEQTASQNAQIKAAALKQLGLYRSSQVQAKSASLAQSATRIKNQQAASIRSYNLSVAKFNKSVQDDNRKQTQASPSMSRARGFLADASGNPILNKQGNVQTLPGYKMNAAGKVVKVATPRAPTTAAGGKPMTATQVNSFVKGLSLTQHQYDPTTRTSQTTVTGHKMNYQAAYNYLTRHGVSDVDARAALDTTYQRGQDGRGWLTNEQRQVLAQGSKNIAGPRLPNFTKAKVVTIQGERVGYLDPTQVGILNARGLTPRGEWGLLPDGQTRVWYIHPGLY
jgi:hypothetical protein